MELALFPAEAGPHVSHAGFELPSSSGLHLPRDGVSPYPISECWRLTQASEHMVFNLVEIHYNSKYTGYYVFIMFSFVFNEVSYSYVFNSLIHRGDS